MTRRDKENIHYHSLLTTITTLAELGYSKTAVNIVLDQGLCAYKINKKYAESLKIIFEGLYTQDPEKMEDFL